MKILIFSDLHLEHKPDWTIPESFPEHDVVVAAGDIDGSPARSIRRLASEPGLQDKPIVFVAGNHEFYRHVLEDAIEEGNAAAAETGVHFLNGDSVVIDGVRFVGATLWTDYFLLGNRALGMLAADEAMNDHRLIKRRAIRASDPGNFRFTPKDAAWHHARQRSAIERKLAEPFDGSTVVVTHHAPSRQSIHPRHLGTPLDAAYASDLEGVMLQWKPALWLHGHVHDSFDYVVGKTRVLSNPKGYGPTLLYRETWENFSFDPHRVIELPTRGIKDEPTEWKP